MKTHARFLDYVDTLDYMEVCRVVIDREGEYRVSEPGIFGREIRQKPPPFPR